MYSKNITYRLIIIFAAILAVDKCSQPEKSEYSVWVYSIDSLANKIYQCESSISKFQYYYPYHREQSIVRIVYDDTICVDYYKGNISFPNEICRERFYHYVKEKNLSFSEVKNRIVGRMTSLLDCGIYSMSYNDSILKVMTVYSKNEKYTKGDSVIGFIFCKTRPSSEMRKSFIRVHSNLKEVKENTFYFETKR